MQYGASQFLFLLFAVPVLVVIVVMAVRVRRHALDAFIHAKLRELMTQDHSRRKSIIKVACVMAAIVLMIVAFARPQWGREQVEVRRKGIDLMFILDTSLSMLAEDIAPNRFEKAKLEVLSFASQMKGNRIGLVMFAGASYLICPLTIDHGAFRLFLKTQKVGAVGEQGTALAHAVDMAFRAMQRSKTKNKAVVIFSDGEDHEGYIDAIITKAKKNRIPLYCIGMGRKEGAPIPIKDENKKILGYKKETSGQVVMSKLHDTLLLRLAKETGGLYFPSTAGEAEVDTIVRHLDTFEKTQFDSKFFTQKEEKYHIFLWLALIALVVEAGIARRRRSSRLQTRVLSGMLLIAVLFLSTAAAPSLSQDMIDGNAAYHAKDYPRAVECYTKATVKYPDSADAFYNLGNAYYASLKFVEAEKAYKKALALSPEKSEPMGNIMYNLGNTLYRLERDEDALKLYKNVLQLRENDDDAKYNIEYIKKKKKPLEQENNDQQQKKNDKQQQQKNEQQQNGQGQQQKNDSSGGESQDQKDDSQGADGQDTTQSEKDEQKKQQDSQDSQNSDQSDQQQSQEQEQNEQQQQNQQDMNNPAEQTPQEGDQDGRADIANQQPQQQVDQTNEQSEQMQQQEDTQEQTATRPDEKKSEESANETGNEQQQEKDKASEEEALRVLRALQESEEHAGMIHFTSPLERRQETKGKDW